MEYIDPTYDAGFKLVFGREHVSEGLLVSLFNSLFASYPDLGNIREVAYLNTERQHERVDGKTVRYDILCQTDTGKRFIVEMQKNDQAHLFERAIYYVSRSITEQGYKGKDSNDKEWDFSLVPVIGVFFCNFRHKALPEKPFVHVSLRDDETGKPMADYFRLFFVQLPLFDKEQEDCLDMKDKWTYNIKNMGTMQRVAFTGHDEVFRRLDNISNVAALSAEERCQYEADLRYARDYNAQLKFAIQEGLEEGRKEGREEGREEAVINMAKKLISKGETTEYISEITSLPADRIKELRRSTDR